MKNKWSVRMMVYQALLAALYAAVTLLFAPISYGPLQCRLSEALTVLPFFGAQNVIGLTVGCLIANLLGGSVPLDIVFGTLATLIAGLLTARMPKAWLAPLPPVIINGLVVGAVIAYTTAPDAFWPSFALFGAQVAVGELFAVYPLGLALLYGLQRRVWPRGTDAVK